MKPLVIVPRDELHTPEAVVDEWRKILGGSSRAEALKRMEEENAKCVVWTNGHYQVEVRREPGSLTQINIRRCDGKAIFRDWREFQEIKNQVCGPEFEAIELYPAESRLVDTTNKYHLWCAEEPGFRFPVG